VRGARARGGGGAREPRESCGRGDRGADRHRDRAGPGGGGALMFLARVCGEVVATVKHPHLATKKLLLIRPEPTPGRPEPAAVLAVDTVDAGVGDRVLVADEGNAAAQVLGMPRGPVRTVIVGVVDSVEQGDRWGGGRAGGAGPRDRGPAARVSGGHPPRRRGTSTGGPEEPLSETAQELMVDSALRTGVPMPLYEYRCPTCRHAWESLLNRW